MLFSKSICFCIILCAAVTNVNFSRAWHTPLSPIRAERLLDKKTLERRPNCKLAKHYGINRNISIFAPHHQRTCGREDENKKARKRATVIGINSDEGSNGVEYVTWRHFDRRKHLLLLAQASSLLWLPTVEAAVLPTERSAIINGEKDNYINDSKMKKTKSLKIKEHTFGINDEIVSSLVYKRILGKGSYKTVYLVSGEVTDSSNDELTNTRQVQFAMAVERLRYSSDVDDGVNGIQIAEELEKRMTMNTNKMRDNSNNHNLFERIEGWWFQSKPLASFSENGLVFTDTFSNGFNTRTATSPNKFLGSKWLVALKPVYDMDLRSFMKKFPIIYPIGYSETKDMRPERTNVVERANTPTSYSMLYSNSKALESRPLVPESSSSGGGSDINGLVGNALTLAYDMCYTGEVMRSLNLVHRDIKPQNIMLSNGHAVVIDFGFSRFVRNNDAKSVKLTTTSNNEHIPSNSLCINQQVGVKGELPYMLANDVKMSRGCEEGDRFAMGKTLYEVLFDAFKDEEINKIGSMATTYKEVLSSNEEFRMRLTNHIKVFSSTSTATASRFQLSRKEHDVLTTVICGLCRDENPISFTQAKEIILGPTHIT